MDPQQIASVVTFVQVIMALNAGGLLGCVIVGVKIVRHMGRMEERFDLVWSHFKRTVLNRRESDSDENE